MVQFLKNYVKYIIKYHNLKFTIHNVLKINYMIHKELIVKTIKLHLDALFVIIIVEPLKV